MLVGTRSALSAFPDTIYVPAPSPGPAVPVDPFYSYVYGLYHFDGDYSDSGPGGTPLQTSGTTALYGVNTSNPRFGTGSMQCTRGATANGFVKVRPSPTLNAAGDFAFEFWMRTTGVQGTYSCVFETLGAATISATAPPKAALGVVNWTNAAGTGTGSVTLTCYLNAPPDQLRLTSKSNPNNGQWHHIALTRQGTTCRLFFDGALEASGTYALPLDLGQTYGMVVGRYTNTDTSNIFNGWLDDLRITIGVARYTSNFTIPSEAFPNSG